MFPFLLLLACGVDPAQKQETYHPEDFTRRYETCTYLSSMPTASWDVCPTIAEGRARMTSIHPQVARDYPSCTGFYAWPWLAPPADEREMSWRFYCAATITNIEKAPG